MMDLGNCGRFLRSSLANAQTKSTPNPSRYDGKASRYHVKLEKVAIAISLGIMILSTGCAKPAPKDLVAAAEKGDTATVQSLLGKGADVNGKAEKDETALMGAAMNGHTDTVQTLLSKGADVNAKANEDRK